MLSVETEARVAKLLLSLAEGERSVEISRQVLSDNYDFDPYQIFRLLYLKFNYYINYHQRDSFKSILSFIIKKILIFCNVLLIFINIYFYEKEI